MKDVLVYLDEGASPYARAVLLDELRRILSSESYTVRGVLAEEILGGDWQVDTAVLVFPGGRDIPYLKKLQGLGNRIIREYVQCGGLYLGLCAGAYYACAEIEFERGMPLEVCGKRELSFYERRAVGPVYGPGAFQYDSDVGARAARITPEAHLPNQDQEVFVYYNGGCYFEEPEALGNVQVLARFSEIESNPAAVVHCCVGSGAALLSGVHPEYPAEKLLRDRQAPKEMYDVLLDHEKRRQEFLCALLARLGLEISSSRSIDI